MTTYKDHPHAFLTGRVTSRGLRMRSDSWREQRLSVQGIDVPKALEKAADLVDEMMEGFGKVADLIDAGASPSTIRAAVLRLHVPDVSVTDGIWEAGQFLRIDFRDPHGGSTASHLEMAADELRHLCREAKRLVIMQDCDPDEIREVAFGAIGRLVAQPSHEGPAFRM